VPVQGEWADKGPDNQELHPMDVSRSHHDLQKSRENQGKISNIKQNVKEDVKQNVKNDIKNV